MRAAVSSLVCSACSRRAFSSTVRRPHVKDVTQLPDRVAPLFRKRKDGDLMELRWPSPLRNVLLLKKDGSPPATEALLEFAQYITTSYPDISLITDSGSIELLNESLPTVTCASAYNISRSASDSFEELPHLHAKTDLIVTFGGDGTILLACSLFSALSTAPPILSFAMGTLGFLGEWRFKDYKHAFHALYTSGKAFSSSPEQWQVSNDQDKLKDHQALADGFSTDVMFRRRLKVALDSPWSSSKQHHAMNEVLLYRTNPHLIHILIHVNGRFLTEAVADGMLVSTPTGSTAYSLSSGGSIIHPTVPALLLTPICPRSLSFRPLVLPASSEITLTLSDKNRSREAEFSIDGRPERVGIGHRVRVTGERATMESSSTDTCGVPFIMRGDAKGGDDRWVGGLTNLLKFNYPFAAEED